MRSLTAKFVLWNSVLLLGALSGFGWIQLQTTERTVLDMLDRELLGRAEGFARGRPGGPPPTDEFRPRIPQRPLGDDPIRQPRAFDMSGQRTDPNRPEGLWSREMFDRSVRGQRLVRTISFEDQPYRVVSIPMPGRDRQAGVVQLAQPLAPYVLAQQAQRNALLMALPLAFLAAAGIGVLMARVVIRPVSRITEAAEKIAAQPTRVEPIQVNGADEIARLATSLNTMTGALQSANAELTEALNQQKRFTSDAAHELRTPLTSISLATENGLHPEATPEELRQSLSVVQRGANSMSRLTQLLLTLARADSRDEPLSLSSWALRDVAAEAVATLAAADRVDIEIPRDAAAHVNRDATIQIVRNLVENALAHSSGRVLVSVSGDTLCVTDEGIGISPEHLPHLFDRFYRVDASRQRASGGFGLGLAIVRSLCEAQRAEVWAESEPGRGTTFFVKFAKSPESS